MHPENISVFDFFAKNVSGSSSMITEKLDLIAQSRNPRTIDGLVIYIQVRSHVHVSFISTASAECCWAVS
jgi:hypothetical protein